MRFSLAAYLPALLVAAILLPLLALWALRSAERARARLVDREMLPKLAHAYSNSRRRLRIVLQVSALLLLLFALAGPRVGSREVTLRRRGIDIIFAIDTSLSMTARDIPPSRLQKAKHEVSSFLDRLQGDRVGIVAFAGDAFLQCPLTLDYGAARMFMSLMDEHSVTKQGTSVGAAVRRSLAAFGEGEDKHRAIVLVTDGEDFAGSAMAAAEEAAERGIRIFAIGIGSEAGEPIPLPENGTGGGGFKRDADGEIIMSVLDAETLERIALATDGEFHRATTGELELDRIYQTLQELGEREVASRAFTQFEERFQFPLGLGLLLLLIDFALPDRVRRREEWEGRFA